MISEDAQLSRKVQVWGRSWKMREKGWKSELDMVESSERQSRVSGDMSQVKMTT